MEEYSNSESENLSDISEYSENFEINSSTDSENESCEERIDLDEEFIAKNKMKWSSVPVEQPIGSVARNVLRTSPGPTRYATSRCSDIESAFLLFFPPNVMNIIITNTNKFGLQKFGEAWENLDEKTLKAYFAVLILAGLYRAKNEDIHGLFDEKFGRPIFRAIMSEKKFKMIGRALRFDDVQSRRNQRSDDKFAPIRELWNIWQDILPKLYNCYENVTIDEQLVPFRGRCSFRQYMPSKPAKYGIKFWLAVDSKSKYVWKIQPYLGKQANLPPEKKQGERVVMDLVDGLRGQNITTDNFFTSFDLGQKLLKKKLTLVGTVRKNKTFIPPKLLIFKKVPLYSCAFAFEKSTTLVSYIGRKNKGTILLSTMHPTAHITDGPKKLPEIVSYYNKTKGGVDSADQMLSCYSAKRKTNRWPNVVFSNIIDISALNAFVIYSEIDRSWATTDMNRKRQAFLRSLAMDLAKEYMQSRTHAPIPEASARILQDVQAENRLAEAPSSSPNPSSRKRGICSCFS